MLLEFLTLKFQSAYTPVLLLTYVMLLATFTVATAAIFHATRERSVGLWLVSDFCTLITVFLVASRQDLPPLIGYQLHSIPMVLSVFFKILAVLPKEASSCRGLSVAILIFTPLFNLMLPHDDNNSFRLSVNSAILGTMTLIATICLLNNADLRKSLGGKWIIVASSFSAIMFFVRWFITVTTGSGEAIGYFRATGIDSNVTQTIAVTLLVLILVLALSHIAFLVFVLEQLKLREISAKIEVTRENERRLAAEQKQLQSAREIEERANMIGILTHEVRQPLNNASAILQRLQSILPVSNDLVLSKAISSAQDVMDQVTMALSNAIIAASLLDRQSEFKSARCETRSIIEMAITDSIQRPKERIDFQFSSGAEFITADPILLRIAIRNLIDNALKYSPDGTRIRINVAENEEWMGVNICVQNEEVDSAWSKELDVFAPRIRGKNATTHGAGLGLFIVAETVKLHNGSVKTRVDGHARVFEIFLPD
jgi:signal transduction histidine kinase